MGGGSTSSGSESYGNSTAGGGSESHSVFGNIVQSHLNFDYTAVTFNNMKICTA